MSEVGVGVGARPRDRDRNSAPGSPGGKFSRCGANFRRHDQPNSPPCGTLNMGACCSTPRTV